MTGAARRQVRITGWGRYAPEHVLTNADLERIVDTSDEWIVTRTGIRERRVAGPTETTASMGAVAGLRAIRTAGLDPDAIDLVIVATLSPDHPMPATAVLVKEAIGNRRAAAFDLGAACSGFVYAYATASAYLAAGLAEHVLVVGSELLTRYLDFGDRSTCILFGDGAGAVVLSATDEPTAPVGIELTADPRGAYMLWLPAGGSRSPSCAGTVARNEHTIRMDGRETYRFATRTLAATGLAAVAKAGWTPAEVDLIVPHQANLRIIETVARELAIPLEKMFVNLERYGNTSAASVPIALTEAVNGGRVRPGDRVVLVAFGAGFTSGAIALEWTADPAAGPAGEAAVDPASVTVPVPPGWGAEDPTPPQLAEVVARRPPAAPARPPA